MGTQSTWGSNNHFKQSIQSNNTTLASFHPSTKTTPNNQNGLLQVSHHRLRGRCCLRRPPGCFCKNTEVKVSGQDNSPKCGNGQKIACCNSGEDLIGLNCLSIPILAIPIQQACGSNVAACCQTGDAEGNLINLEANCLAIPL